MSEIKDELLRKLFTGEIINDESVSSIKFNFIDSVDEDES